MDMVLFWFNASRGGHATQRDDDTHGQTPQGSVVYRALRNCRNHKYWANLLLYYLNWSLYPWIMHSILAPWTRKSASIFLSTIWYLWFHCHFFKLSSFPQGAEIYIPLWRWGKRIGFPARSTYLSTKQGSSTKCSSIYFMSFHFKQGSNLEPRRVNFILTQTKLSIIKTIRLLAWVTHFHSK